MSSHPHFSALLCLGRLLHFLRCPAAGGAAGGRSSFLLTGSHLNHVQVCVEQEQRFLFLPEAAAIEGPQAPHNLSFLGLMVCVCLYVDGELRSYHEKFCSGLPAGTSLGFAIRVTGQKPAWFTSHCSQETCSGMSLAEGGCCNQSTPLLPLSPPLLFAAVLPTHGGHLQPDPPVTHE